MGAKAALIFGAMDCSDWSFLEPLRQECPTVFCADGGLTCARKAGFLPDYYIGDGDSGGAPQPGIRATVLPVQKDLTDLQAAWEEAYELGFRNICLTGCIGGRQDHHLAALQLLETIRLRGCEGRIMDPENEISFLTPGKMLLQREDFSYFSLIPADAEVTVSISGAKYELSERRVRRGDSLCVSNEFVQTPVELTLSDGSCWLILSQRK